jgi:beta-glucosidase
VTFTDYHTLKRTPKKSALLLKRIFEERMGVSAKGQAASAPEVFRAEL